MTRQAKKDIERLYLDRVRSLLADFPVGEIVEREPPDFLVQAAGRVVGIEITELHRDDDDGQPIPLQARQAVREQIVARAKAIYDADKRNPPVDSKLLIKDLPFSRTDVEPLAHAIADLTRRNIPPEGVLSESEEYDWINRAYYPEVVDRIRVARFEGLTESHFSVDGSAWAGPMGADQVRDVIQAKDASVNEYLRHCDEAWLVIVADNARLSSFFTDDAEVRAAVFATRFARVLVLRNFGPTLIELTTSSA